jgi:hypothetical protein
MNLVFIYGPPAAGKLTVANEIASLTGYKVFHNHLTIDAIEPIFEFGSPSFWKLVEKVRLDVISEAAEANISLIYTFCYAKDHDDLHIERVIQAIESKGGKVCFVLLAPGVAELETRVVDKSRKAFGKAQTLETLHQIIDRYELFSPVPQRESLRIDNSKLSPRETAQKVIAHYRLL